MIGILVCLILICFLMISLRKNKKNKTGALSLSANDI
jgi:hypothetical protein